MEQEEYKKEEIDWSYIEFVDNQDILDLIEKVSLLTLQILSCRLFGFVEHIHSFWLKNYILNVVVNRDVIGKLAYGQMVLWHIFIG